jgi:LPXTG-site transpeptidase (sortase) family protein
MISFIKKHRGFVILCAVLILAAAAAASIISHKIYDIPDMSKEASETINDLGVFPIDTQAHGSEEGEIVIGADAGNNGQVSAPMYLTSNPDTIWSNPDTYAGTHTPIEAAKMQDDSIGILSIPALRLSVNVYESEDAMEAMSKGVAHFPSTSAFDGNVGLSAHNVNSDGSAGFFGDLHTLRQGDVVILKTGLGEREYVVSSVSTIAASDWSPLHYTDDNRLTMITCISGQPDKRLCVIAVEKV